MNNYEILTQETQQHFNELVITPGGHVGRLIGFYDGEDDYYYIVLNMYGAEHRQTYWSCVGALIYLKNQISAEEYDVLDRTAELAGAPKADAYIHKKWQDR